MPQLFIDIDREQVMRTGTPMQSVFDSIQVFLGSAYVNDFTYEGRIYQVTAQADQEHRNTADDIANLQLRGASGEMIPMGSVATVEETYGPQSITRFQQAPSMKILGNNAAGFSSGDALNILEEMATDLPTNMSYAWSELSYQEKEAAGGTTAIFVFAIIMVYLVLAAQYESWSIPISVVLSIPTALLGAVAAIWLRAWTTTFTPRSASSC